MNIKDINTTKKYSFACIYLWTNLINGKHYVGQTKNFYNRMMQYKYYRTNEYFKNALMKYGFDNFEITILEKLPTDKNMLTEREQYWINYYESYDVEKGYNICKIASTTLGYQHTEQTKEILSQKSKDRFSNYENRFIGDKNGMYGKSHDEEWRNAHSEFLKNKWETDEEYRKFWHEKMSGENNYFYGKHLFGEANGMYGKHHSEETKRKIADALRGRKGNNGKK